MGVAAGAEASSDSFYQRFKATVMDK